MFKSVILKRLLTVFLAAATVFTVFANQVPKTSAHSSLDQYTLAATGYWRIETHKWVGQTFRPTFNKLDGLGVYSGIQSLGPSSCTLTVSLWKNNTPPIKIAEESTTIYKVDAYTIIEIPAVDVVPDARYTMYVSASSSYAYWLFNGSDIYPRGTAIVDSITDPTQDFVFATFGYNDTPPATPDPAPTPTIEGDTGGDAAVADSSSSSSSENSATSSLSTSSSITPPTKLSATANSESNSIDLSWTATVTTGITGYRVMRSLEETKGFTEIGTTDSKTLTFKDEKSVANQKYYYAVRAYKDKSESKNSNIASATLVDTTAPLTPKNFKIQSQNETEIVFTWDKNTETDLANYILSVSETNNEFASPLITIDTIGKDDTTYTLKLADNPTLSKDKKYYFGLQAKDISNNYSPKATVDGMFAKKINSWLWLGIGGAVVLVALGLLIFFIIRKRKRSSKKIN